MTVQMCDIEYEDELASNSVNASLNEWMQVVE